MRAPGVSLRTGRAMRIPSPDHVPLSAFTAIVLSASALGAQAPVITPAGDPSVRNDTIYSLAANPKALPKDLAKLSYVILLDDGVARFEAD